MDQLFYKRFLGILLLTILLAFGTKFQLFSILLMPNHSVAFAGEPIASTKNKAVSVSVSPKDNPVVSNKNGKLYAAKGGDASLLYKIAGIPVKKVNVKVIKDFRVFAGGQSIGITMNSKGVLIVGYHMIQTNYGKVSPGEKAGVKVGDILTHINGKKIEEMHDLTPFIEESGRTGRSLYLTILRDGRIEKCKLEPAKDASIGSYKLGLYIRDRAAGIGTLTFIHPETNKYGALGHVISDVDTKDPILVENGSIVRSTVTAINRGTQGTPGEKLARFDDSDPSIGTVQTNSPFGVYGVLNKPLKNGIFDKKMQITLSNQVHVGKAQILTVLNNQRVEAFDVQVVSSVPQKFPATKGIVIKVTDEALLKKTGGIVQGMSGSPIIQDGKLIGAITHVFVNDPTSGYGVHIEWMLQEAGIDIYDHVQTISKKAS